MLRRCVRECDNDKDLGWLRFCECLAKKRKAKRERQRGREKSIVSPIGKAPHDNASSIPSVASTPVGGVVPLETTKGEVDTNGGVGGATAAKRAAERAPAKYCVLEQAASSSTSQHQRAGGWGGGACKRVVSGGWGKHRGTEFAASNLDTQHPMHSHLILVKDLPNDATALLIRNLQIGIVDDVLKVAQLLASLVEQEHWFTDNGAWIKMAKRKMEQLKFPRLVSQHCESQETGWLKALTLGTNTRTQIQSRMAEDLREETEEVDDRCKRIILDLMCLLDCKHVQLTSAAFAVVALSCKHFCSSSASLQSSLMGKAPVITSGHSSFRSLLQCQRAQCDSQWCCSLSDSPLLADRMPRVQYMYRNLSQQDTECFENDDKDVHVAFVGTAARLLSFRFEKKIDSRVLQEVHDVRFKHQDGPGSGFKAISLLKFLEFFEKVVDKMQIRPSARKSWFDTSTKEKFTWEKK